MIKKTAKRIQNKDDYEVSNFKDIIGEQVPSKDETTRDLVWRV